MMRRLALLLGLFCVIAGFSSCAAFLEDYNYAPIGTTSSSNAY